MALDVIAFDADDTLWHNEPLYLETQKKFQALLSPYADEQQVQRTLDQNEMRNLAHYGYGIKSFTLSMIESAIILSDGEIRGAEVQKIIGFAKEMLASEVRLFPHIEEALKALNGSHTLMVITKGDLLDQETKLTRSGLASYFQHLEVVSHKTPQTYEALLARHGVAPQRFLMVGNSLRSDILPVLALGGQAVYIPYDTTWAHEVVDGPDPDHEGYYELQHAGQLPDLISKMHAA